MGMNKSIRIGNRIVGTGEAVFIIAEVSANHNQDFDTAKAIIAAAKEAGADAVKMQTYTADTLTIDCDNDYFHIKKGTLWVGKTLYNLYKEAYTPWEWQPDLKRYAEDLGMIWFSTAFDFTAVDFLEGLNVPVHKIASFENVDSPLIEKMGNTGKPVLISCGMANLGEIEEAVIAGRKAGADGIALLKCTSAYPAPYEEMNLRTIPNLAKTFDCPVGLSDHTLGWETAAAAVSLGACLVEKHFTLSRNIPGPDSAFSMEPEEFKEMVIALRRVEKALGKVHYGTLEQESHSIIFRRSLFVTEDIQTGEIFTERNVRSIRPGYGLPPKYLPEVLGKMALRDLKKGTPLKWEYLGGEK